MIPRLPLARMLNTSAIRTLMNYLIHHQTILEVNERFGFFFSGGYIFPDRQSFPSMVRAFFSFGEYELNAPSLQTDTPLDVTFVPEWSALIPEEKDRVKNLFMSWLVYRLMTDFPNRFIETYNSPNHGGIPINILNLFKNALLPNSGISSELIDNIPLIVKETLVPWNRRKQFVTTLAESGFLPMHRYISKHPELNQLLKGSTPLDNPEEDRERIQSLTRRQLSLIRDASVRSDAARQSAIRTARKDSLLSQPALFPPESSLAPSISTHHGELPPDNDSPVMSAATKNVLSNPKLVKDIASFLGGVRKPNHKRSKKNKSKKRKSSRRK
jgi:hypothetical protein